MDSLCQIMCTQEEIGHIIDCDVETLQAACRRDKKMDFSAYYKKKSAPGKMSLRRKQFEMALVHGNITMLIWLGKQQLGQSEKIENTEEGGAALADLIKAMDAAANAAIIQPKASGSADTSEQQDKPPGRCDIVG